MAGLFTINRKHGGIATKNRCKFLCRGRLRWTAPAKRVQCRFDQAIGMINPASNATVSVT